MDELRVTWGIPEDVFAPYEMAVAGGEAVLPLHVTAGFNESELAAIEADAPVPLRAQLAEGSVGKGAAGYGFTLVLDLMGHVADLGGVIALGEFLRRVIKQQLQKRGEPTLSDPAALGAVAAASVNPELLAGCRLCGTVPVTASLGSGTDSRDIWAACFDGEGHAVLVFMSPSGMCLGSVSVPAEWGLIDGEYRSRTPEEISEWWSSGGRGLPGMSAGQSGPPNS